MSLTIRRGGTVQAAWDRRLNWASSAQCNVEARSLLGDHCFVHQLPRRWSSRRMGYNCEECPDRIKPNSVGKKGRICADRVICTGRNAKLSWCCGAGQATSCQAQGEQVTWSARTTATTLSKTVGLTRIVRTIFCSWYNYGWNLKLLSYAILIRSKSAFDLACPNINLTQPIHYSSPPGA